MIKRRERDDDRRERRDRSRQRSQTPLKDELEPKKEEEDEAAKKPKAKKEKKKKKSKSTDSSDQKEKKKKAKKVKAAKAVKEEPEEKGEEDDRETQMGNGEGEGQVPSAAQDPGMQPETKEGDIVKSEVKQEVQKRLLTVPDSTPTRMGLVEPVVLISNFDLLYFCSPLNKMNV